MGDIDQEHRRTGNRVLDALATPAFERMDVPMTSLELKVGTVLFEPDTEIDMVYFPVSGVVSLVTPLEEGAIVEVATIGNEGIVGVPHALDGGQSAVRAVSQVAGGALALSASDFRTEMRRNAQLSSIVARYTDALFGQIAQAAGCNRLHSNEERLSRWLLLSHDRVGRDEFSITQEFLAQMLGSRRATVSVSASVLQHAGLIRYSRGHLTIVDRAGLEQASCECYRVISRALDRVTAPP
jgi:CRP-like cAMP-binding protein